MSTLKAAKKALRSQIKDRLATVDAQSIAEQSLKAQETILALAEYRQAKSVSIYLSMPYGEASTDLIVKDALHSDKAVYVPYMYKTTVDQKQSKIMDMLRLQSLAEYRALIKDSWGIPTLPEADLDTRDNALGGQGLSNGIATDPQLDLVILPAVAFDRNMQRLGHGAGYYDSFLSRYNKSLQKMPFLIGMCLTEQILRPREQVPVTEHDWSVDVVVSGDGCVLRPCFAS